MKRLIALCSIALLSACGSETFQDKSYVAPTAPGYIKGTSKLPNVKIGRPYTIAGKRYYPAYDPDYDETGLASWYGPNFHGKPTANGEKYNQWAMTAAHKTLPLPSMVRVTRLDNGKSIVVRVNDRGPFADGRIIDLSRAAAEALGTRAMGLAKVRVEYLPEETERYISGHNLERHSKMPKYAGSTKRAKSVEEVEYLTFDTPDDDVIHEAPDETLVAQSGAIVTDSLPPLTPQRSQQARELIKQAAPKKKELGYVEDAFSVLDRIDSNHKPSAIELKPNDPPALYNLRRVQKLDTPLYVQVASFSDKANAISLAEKLADISAVEIHEVDVKGRMWYRVRLGPTQNRAIADELKERVGKWGVKDARIIQDNPQ